MNERVNPFAIEDAGTTVVHPLGLLLLIICAAIFITVPRKYAVWPLVALVCFVSGRQCIALFGLNIYFIRLFVVAIGPLRLIARNEFKSYRFNHLDWLIVAYGAVFLLTGIFNWSFSLSAVKFRLGLLVDSVGLYFLLRSLICSPDDVRSIMRCLALFAIPLSAFFLVEQLTGQNLFAVFGGVPAITEVRQGRLRSQGAFGHPILAGTVLASFIPLLVNGAVSEKRSRAVMIVGLAAACVVVVLSASSTPALGAVVAFVGMALFPLRRYSRYAFALTAVVLTILHFSMKAPVWHLIARINVTSGNSGYHRFLLVDGFIRHWREWWILGSRVGTGHWGHFTFDAANHYVVVGIQGGMLLLCLFFAIIITGLLYAGQIQFREPLLGWAIGLSILVHCVCFFGISIWGQLHFSWALSLAMASSLAAYKQTRTTRQPVVISPSFSYP